MRAYWNSRYRPIACHVLSFRELRLVVDYLEGSLSVATWDDTAWIGGTASGTIYRSVVVIDLCHGLGLGHGSRVTWLMGHDWCDPLSDLLCIIKTLNGDRQPLENERISFTNLAAKIFEEMECRVSSSSSWSPWRLEGKCTRMLSICGISWQRPVLIPLHVCKLR